MTSRRRWPLVTAAAIGVALVLAPVVFQMFTRAPEGGTMIKGFKPYMTTETIATFRGDLAVIGSASHEVTALQGRIPRTDPGIATFQQRWPGIDADMSAMLSTMAANLGHYQGVAALPPFVLFPWFFVLPGIFVVALAVLGLRAPPQSTRTSRLRIALAVLGVGIIAAPAIFQMFTRAPGGSKMINAFRPLMTTAKVTKIQGYFLTIGDGEGELRLDVVPQLTAAAVPASELDAITTFTDQWPTIASTMAPMIGAMSDNVGNYDAVKALPPFWLFPWFFVVPGLLVAVLAVFSRPSRRLGIAPAARAESVGFTLQGASP